MAGVIDRDGDPWAVEVKDVNGWTEIAGHCAEAEKEAENAGVVHWIVVKRRRGTTDPGKAYVVSTLADWCAEHGVDL